MGDVENMPRFSRKDQPRARTENLAREPKHRLTLVREQNDRDYPADVLRPKTRGECQEAVRPCPWIGCEHHLYLDVNGLSVKYNFPHIPPDELERLPSTCALDVADNGGVPLEVVGIALNVTRERARQIETAALQKFERRRRDICGS